MISAFGYENALFMIRSLNPERTLTPAQNSTETTPLRRTAREIHYPPGIVDVQDPFILLVHQGMVEDVFLQDLRKRGVEVLRSSPFSDFEYSEGDKGKQNLVVHYKDLISNTRKILSSEYLVGCDGAHSTVRKSMPFAVMDGESGGSTWGVLDGKFRTLNLRTFSHPVSGIIETDFPDLWSKAVISSETAGSILCIPRERNMTRFYIELHPNTEPNTSSEPATEEFVMERAKEIMKPFTISWRTVGRAIQNSKSHLDSF
jgi:phenol 2-monooxygenase